MIKIVDVCSLISGRARKINNEFNDKLVFVEPSDYAESGEFGYKEVSIVNIKSLEKIKYNLPHKTKIINSTNSKNMFYHAELELQDNKSCVNVHLKRLNLETMEDVSVCAIEVFTKDQDEPTDYVALNSKIAGINERYCLFFVPQKKLKYGLSYFSECLLIDCLENKILTVKDELINGDSLLKMQNIWVVNNGQNVIIKTGRIQLFEKREFWNKGIKNDEIPNYFDQNESLIFINTELFIDKIKKNEELTGILDTSDYTSALSFCGWDGYKLTYMKSSFKEARNVISTYVLESGMFERKEVESSCEIVCAAENYYIIEQMNDENMKFIVRDLTGNAVIQIAGYGVIALDEEKIVTCSFDENFEQVICINNIISRELIRKIKTPNFDYDVEKELLIIY